MSAHLTTYIVGPLIGWLVALSVLCVGYLMWVKLKEIRRHRKMDAERERMGLSKSYKPAASWLLF